MACRGCLPEYGSNLICVTVGVFVAAILQLIPGLDRSSAGLNYEEIFNCFDCLSKKDADPKCLLYKDKNWWQCATDYSKGWFGVWTIMFAVVAVWFVVWLFISIFSSMCCNCQFDEYMCLLGVGLFTTFCGDYLLSLIFSGGDMDLDVNGLNVKKSIVISAVFNNFTLIIVHFVFFWVACCVKNWTGCAKVGSIIGGVVLAFVIGIIWILAGAPKACRKNEGDTIPDGWWNNCDPVTCLVGGVIGAACFFLNILFAVILDCSCCKCCGCRACSNNRR